MIRQIASFFTILILSSIFQPTYSQQLFPVKGTVHHAETGEPLPKATIVVVSTLLGTSHPILENNPMGYITVKTGRHRFMDGNSGFLCKLP